MNTKLILNDQILLDAQLGELKSKNQDHVIRLEPLLLELLIILLREPKCVISREQIIEALWAGDQRVGNPALTKAISKLRQLFIQYFNAPDLIETLPKKGYRFTANVRCEANNSKSNAFFVENQYFIKIVAIGALTLSLIIILLKVVLGMSFHQVLHGMMH